ncbi:SDR family oxidoreductase [Microbacterium sp. CGR1]|uniref:SDR family oxidoreductase n=1 Tax=Microbacterium sp. CGR1 TaxID=1696072 RepID=UPI003DA4D231
MRITVIGGTGLIGTRVVRSLRDSGHDIVVASRATGVNSFTGEGLDDALSRAAVVVDVSNSSYTDEAAAQEFFYTSTMNLLSYGEAAGVAHHVALSVVGTDRLARAQGGISSPRSSRSA